MQFQPSMGKPSIATGLLRAALGFARWCLKSDAHSPLALDVVGLSDIGLTRVPIQTTWTHCGSGIRIGPMVKYRYRPAAD
jgi:hypothetical protein